MDPWRLATKAQRRINFVAGLALASCGLAWLAGFGSASTQHISASVENAGAKLIVARHEPSLVASTEPTVIPQATVVANAAIVDVEMATAAEATSQKTTDTTASLDEPKPFVVASLPDSSQVVPPETPSPERTQASTPDPAPEKAADAAAAPDEPKPFVVASLTDSSQVFSPEEVATAPDTIVPAVSTIEINEECLVAEICIDRYLWALYERAPKIDAIEVHERRKVTVRRKGKTVTVTRTFTRRVDEEFGWKDPKAADKAGMAMMDYVIGGMDRNFRLKLFHTLHAAEQAGLQPGITSAFRDDYRQSIATGLKAATDRSYHGGSFRGGYGRGLAADIVSVKGATRAQRWVSTEKLWKWIDERGKEFGIGRPYLDRDPPHVAPIDGKEYVSRRGGAKTQVAEAKPKTRVAEATIKKGKRLAARADHSAAKRARNIKLSKGARTAKLSKGRTM
ncbi:hypothetical protein [Bradyrhizobium sp. AZCC 1693]|uniref:hypothetical protein n=1 Tax=Bradyrhizobium sp. AZCC 1693 TaxID=3117029 RepID=UPI002FF264BA